MKILALTVSDRASRGVYEDKTGPAAVRLLREKFPDAEIRNPMVPDEREQILRALEEGRDADLILTLGGTGLGPRDVTPEATEAFCDRKAPGIAEYLRIKSLEETPFSPLSRGTAGLHCKTLVVNMPGSVRGVEFGIKTLFPLLSHAFLMIEGGSHEKGKL